MRPIALGPNQPPKFYRGGAAIAAFRQGSKHAAGDGPEDWIASTVGTFGTTEGLTTLPDGRLLRDAIAADPIGFLGPRHHASYGTDTALLVKLLDAGQRLPVHVHPDREFAARHLGSVHGKTEAWVILGTSAPGAAVYVGFRDDVDENQLAAWLSSQDSPAMLAALNPVHVEPGDTVVVPAGTPHAIGEGILLLELQEPTDFSIMLEWAAFGLHDSANEQLGLPSAVALSCLNRTRWDDEKLDTHVIRQGFQPRGGVTSLFRPVADPFFRAEYVVCDGSIDFAPQYGVAVMLNGKLQFTGTDGELTMRRGDTALVPYGAGDLQVAGRGEFIRCLPPATA